MDVQVANLSSEMGNINMDLFHRPAKCAGNKGNKPFSILRGKELAELSNFLILWVLGPGTQRALDVVAMLTPTDDRAIVQDGNHN